MDINKEKYMSKKFKTTWFYSELDTYEQEVKTGMFKKENKEYYTQRRVNFDQFAKSLEKKYEELDNEGYEVINVIPMAMGTSESCTNAGQAYLGDVGFSVTRGAVVVGKKKEI